MQWRKKKGQKKKALLKEKKSLSIVSSVQKKITFIVVYLMALENVAEELVCIFLVCHGSTALALGLEIPWSRRRAKAARPGSALGGSAAAAPL